MTLFSHLAKRTCYNSAAGLVRSVSLFLCVCVCVFIFSYLSFTLLFDISFTEG